MNSRCPQQSVWCSATKQSVAVAHDRSSARTARHGDAPPAPPLPRVPAAPPVPAPPVPPWPIAPPVPPPSLERIADPQPLTSPRRSPIKSAGVLRRMGRFKSDSRTSRVIVGFSSTAVKRSATVDRHLNEFRYRKGRHSQNFEGEIPARPRKVGLNRDCLLARALLSHRLGGLPCREPCFVRRCSACSRVSRRSPRLRPTRRI